jgi:hypothetical protein
MGITFVDACIVLEGVIDVEQADLVHAWLQDNACWGVDFRHCSHLHPATLQVLLCAGLPALRWPQDARLAMWLGSVMREG